MRSRGISVPSLASASTCAGLRSVRPYRQGVNELRCLPDEIQSEALLLEGTQHLLLAIASCEIVVVMTSAHVAEGGASIHVLKAGCEVNTRVVVVLSWILVILNRCGNVDHDAAYCIDDPDEALEVDLGVVMDGDAKIIFDGCANESGSGDREFAPRG